MKRRLLTQPLATPRCGMRQWYLVLWIASLAFRYMVFNLHVYTHQQLGVPPPIALTINWERSNNLFNSSHPRFPCCNIPLELVSSLMQLLCLLCKCVALDSLPYLEWPFRYYDCRPCWQGQPWQVSPWQTTKYQVTFFFFFSLSPSQSVYVHHCSCKNGW